MTDATPVGDVVASASCTTSNGATFIWSYPAITVHVSTFRRLDVTPATLAPGRTLTVRETGACPDTQLPVRARVWLAPAARFPAVAEEYVAADTAYNWEGRLTIPTNTAPGAYFVFAVCHGPSRDTGTAFYPPVPITIT